MKKFAIAALILFTFRFGHAVVDMKNGNNAENWIDLNLPSAGYSLRVVRFYNSRSGLSGIFGNGWCSNFETLISTTPEGRLRLVECGAGHETIYSPKTFDATSMAKVIDAIVAYYFKDNPGAPRAAGESLRHEILSSSALRTNWARRAGVKNAEPKPGTIYLSDNLRTEKILFDGKGFIRTLADGSMQGFDAKGRLISLYDKEANGIKIYSNKRLHLKH